MTCSNNMTCKPNYHLLACLWAGMTLALTGCGKTEPAATPLEKARAKLAQGEMVAAEIAFDRLVASGTPREQVAAYLGEAALVRGDMETARYWLAPKQFDETSRLHGLRMLAQLEIRERRFDIAEEIHQQALAIGAEDPGLHVDIGRLRYITANQLGALQSSLRAIELDPDNVAALLFRGQIARDAEGPESSLVWFRRATEVAPDDIQARLELAATLIDANQEEAAAELLDEARDALKENTQALYLRAIIAARKDQVAAASELLARSGRVEAGVPAAMLLSAALDVRRENFSSAVQLLERLIQRQPDNGRVRELLAYALSRSGEEQELVQRFSGRARGLSGSPYLRTLVGRAYETLGDRESAAIYLDLAARPQRGFAAIARPPESNNQLGSQSLAFDLRDRIRARIAIGDDEGAIAAATDLYRRYPGSYESLVLIGDSYFAAGANDAAWQAYARAATVRQPWPLVIKRAALNVRREKSDEVLLVYATANRGKGELAALAAEAYAADGKWQKSAEYLDLALANGERTVPWILAARSVAARHLGDKDAALGWALEAHDLQPMNEAATEALIAALPESEAQTRSELLAKLRSLRAR